MAFSFSASPRSIFHRIFRRFPEAFSILVATGSPGTPWYGANACSNADEQNRSLVTDLSRDDLQIDRQLDQQTNYTQNRFSAHR